MKGFKMEKIKYIAIYKNSDVAHDNNLYCNSLRELFIFIDIFISKSWYKNLYDFLEDYEICTVGHCNLVKFENNFLNYLENNK